MAKVKERVAPTGKTLAEIAQDRQTLNEFLAEHEGELTPEIEELLGDNDMEAKVKVAKVAQFIEIETAFAKAIGLRASAMMKRSVAMLGRVDWYKNAYIPRALETLGLTLAGDRIDSDEAVVRVQLNNPRLDPVEVDEDVVSSMYNDADVGLYVRQHITYSLDRVALLTDAKQQPELAEILAGRYGITIVRDASVRIA